jgi:serine/threonine-protein kinase HipA
LTIFEDLAAHAERWTQDVIATLPPGFPEDLVKSVADGIAHRVRMIDLMLSLPGEAAATG